MGKGRKLMIMSDLLRHKADIDRERQTGRYTER